MQEAPLRPIIAATRYLALPDVSIFMCVETGDGVWAVAIGASRPGRNAIE